MKQSNAASDIISEQWFLGEQEKRLSQKKVVLDEVDLEPFETFAETYVESPADLSGDSADDNLMEILMGLSFHAEDEDSYEDDGDDDDMPPSRRWTEMELSPEFM